MKDNLRQKFKKLADELENLITNEWYDYLIEAIPYLGDAYGAAKLKKQVEAAYQKLDKLEKQIKDILALQKMKASSLIRASNKTVKGYPSELEHLTYEQIVALTKLGRTKEERETARKARLLQKLIEESERLSIY